MFNQKQLTVLTLSVLLALLFAAVLPLAAFAQDDTPPATEVPAVVDEPVADQPVIEEPAVVDAPVQESTEEDIPVVDAPATGAPTVDVPATDVSVEEAPSEDDPLTVPEIMDAVPAGVDLVVLDENGQPLSLASEATVSTLLAGDPMWCPDGVLPGGANCTASFSSFHDLITELENGTGPDVGSGTIYVAYDYNATTTGDAGSDIVFDYGLIDLTNLVFQGGWNFGTNNVIGTSTIDLGPNNALAFLDWGGYGVPGNLTLKDINVTNSLGLYVGADSNFPTANVTMDNVSVTNTQYGAGVLTLGDVTVVNSNFDSNSDTTGTTVGLEIYAGGNVTLSGVSASNNDGDGVDIHGGFFEQEGPVGATTNVVVTHSVFNGNHSTDPDWGYGLYLDGVNTATVNCSQFTNNQYGIGAYGSGTLTTGNNFFFGNVFADVDNDPGTSVVQGSFDCGGGGGGGGGGSGSGGGDGRGFKPRNNLLQIPVTGEACTDGNGEKKVTLEAGDAFGLYENLCDIDLQLKEVVKDDLPGALPPDAIPLGSLDMLVIADGTVLSELPPGGNVTLKFPIPDATDVSTLVVLFWNGSEWVEVSGGLVVDGFYVVDVEKPGNYVLVIQ